MARKKKRPASPEPSRKWQSPPPTASSAAVATKVFNTVELLENILLNLDTISVLRAQKTNRTFRDTVDGSIKLKRAINLLPTQSSAAPLPLFIQTPQPGSNNFKFHGFNFDVYHEPERRKATRYGPAQPKQTTFQVDATSESMSPLGSRCRALLVTRPPTRVMELEAICRHPTDDDYMRHPFVSIVGPCEASGEFLTIGGLQDALARVKRSWEAAFGRLGRGDQMEIRATFRGLITQ